MHRTITTLVLTTLAWCSPAWGAAPMLYQITDHDPLYQKESAAISGVVDEVEVTLDTGALDQNPRILDLELPDGRRLTVVRSRFDIEPGYLTWVGEVTAGNDGSFGYVHLVDHGDQVSGSFTQRLSRHYWKCCGIKSMRYAPRATDVFRFNGIA